MSRTQFDKDGRDIGLTVADGWISRGRDRGPLAGAHAALEQSVAEPSAWAKLNTPLSLRGTVQGRARLIVTVTCTDGTTLITECPPKHELAARRWVAQVNRV